MVAYLDRAPAMSATQASALGERLRGTIRRYGVPLEGRDLATIDVNGATSAPRT